MLILIETYSSFLCCISYTRSNFGCLISGCFFCIYAFPFILFILKWLTSCFWGTMIGSGLFAGGADYIFWSEGSCLPFLKQKYCLDCKFLPNRRLRILINLAGRRPCLHLFFEQEQACLWVYLLHLIQVMPHWPK